MVKIELGFRGQRFLYLPLPMVDLMHDSPIAGDLYLYSLGYFSCAAHHYINRPSGCDEYLFIYCKSGCGWVEIRDSHYEITENQFIILPRNVRHAYGANLDDPWTIYWIHFRGAKAPLYADRFDSPVTVAPGADSRIEDRLDLFEEIYATLNENTSLDSMHYANLCFAHFLGSFIFINAFRGAKRKKEYSENVINRVIHFMNDNIENRLKIKDFSAFSGYCESYLYRKFVKETGRAPMDYFIQMKINKACMMLLQTDMKINQIASKLGFRDPQYFSRAFSHAMGLSANEFRKQNADVRLPE